MIVQMLSDDIPLDGVLEELGRRADVYGLKKSEALNWILTIPGLDQFFANIVEMKKATKN